MSSDGEDWSRFDVVYTPESRVRRPLALLRDMARSARASRAIAWRLFVRDLTARYRQSLLGFLWAFAPPAFMALGFTLARDSHVVSIGDTRGLPYPVFVMLSMTLWLLFVESFDAPFAAYKGARGRC